MKDKQAVSLELEVIIKMEELKGAHKQQWEVQEQCCCTLPLTGQTFQTHHCGPWVCNRQFGFTTAFQVERQDCLAMTFGPGPSVHHASCMMCMHLGPSTETIACLTKLNELSPHQFAQAFKAAGEKNPDVPSHEEVQRDCKNLKEWLAAALKEIRQLERKGSVWTECLKSEAKPMVNKSFHIAHSNES